MLTEIKQVKEMAKHWNALKSDIERLTFLKLNKGNMMVILDNDQTQVAFNKDGFEDEVHELIYPIESELNPFDDYHGYSDGVVLLFKFAGIDAETV
jgi:hypothetical protein